MLYHVALFAHITGVLAFFFAIGLELTILRSLRRAQTLEQVRVWLRTAQWVHKLFPMSTVLILAAGLYMTLAGWGIGTAWIAVSLILLMVLSALGPLVNARRFAAIHRAAQAVAGNAITADLRRRLDDPVLRTSIQVMAAVSLGIVFLMTLKPDLLGSLATIAVAVVVGALSALPTRQRVPAAGPAVIPAAARETAEVR